jgi:hypothetical protein
LTLGFLSLALLGCGSEETAPWAREVQPASGKVLLAGKALPDIAITFHPLDETAASQSGVNVLSRAKTASDGSFAVSTYEANDGLPVGEYRLSFSYLGPLTGLSEDQIDRLRERLNRKYLKPQTSGVTVAIVAGNNDIPLIDLTK